MKKLLLILLEANAISKTDDKSINNGLTVCIVAIIISFIIAIILVESGV